MRPKSRSYYTTPPPPPLKLSHKYATEVAFQIYKMGPLAHYMADDFFIPNPPLPFRLGCGRYSPSGVHEIEERQFSKILVPSSNSKYKRVCVRNILALEIDFVQNITTQFFSVQINMELLSK